MESRKEEFVKLLGSGSYAYVNLVRYTNPDGSSFLSAVKNSYEEYVNLQREFQVMRKLSGYPGIVKCFSDSLEEGVSSFGNQVYKLQLEYASEGSLDDFMDNYTERKLPESLIKSFTRMILQGVVSIHGNGYVHCDIKPGNILLFPSGDSSYELKISDFGNTLQVGKVSHDWGVHNRFLGTPNYMAPESLRNGVADKTLDLWSVGCLVLEMYTGVVPWEGMKFDDLTTSLLDGKAPVIPESLPSDAKDFIKTCFSRKLEERRSAYELLFHPFLPRREEEEKTTEKIKRSLNKIFATPMKIIKDFNLVSVH